MEGETLGGGMRNEENYRRRWDEGVRARGGVGPTEMMLVMSVRGAALSWLALHVLLDPGAEPAGE